MGCSGALGMDSQVVVVVVVGSGGGAGGDSCKRYVGSVVGSTGSLVLCGNSSCSRQ